MLDLWEISKQKVGQHTSYKGEGMARNQSTSRQMEKTPFLFEAPPCAQKMRSGSPVSEPPSTPDLEDISEEEPVLHSGDEGHQGLQGSLGCSRMTLSPGILGIRTQGGPE